HPERVGMPSRPTRIFCGKYARRERGRVSVRRCGGSPILIFGVLCFRFSFRMIIGIERRRWRFDGRSTAAQCGRGGLVSGTGGAAAGGEWARSCGRGSATNRRSGKDGSRLERTPPRGGRRLL